ncbi:hypothetical protein [Nonomuraea sp. CA-141351]|uniref:hypothetical protein n=1 Tax=Nonomuraea sp. CA-141351 TaxID=3239996 RepID=UPI003D948ED9
MTANKNFKRRVRERAARTGESYTAALLHLRRIDAKEHFVQWQRFVKPEFGYAIHVPQGWDERPPNLKNSPWETARYGDRSDRRHSIIVFRPAFHRPQMTATEAAEMARHSLEAAGFSEFALTEAEVAGITGARLTFAKHDAGRIWAVSEYFVVHDDVRFVLGCGSAIPEEDESLFTAIARQFEILPEAAQPTPAE